MAKKADSPKVDRLRQMREAKYENARKKTTREGTKRGQGGKEAKS